MTKWRTKYKNKRYYLKIKSKIILFYWSLQTKENIVDKSISLMESKFGVDRTVISSWLKKGDKILESSKKRISFMWYMERVNENEIPGKHLKS